MVMLFCYVNELTNLLFVDKKGIVFFTGIFVMILTVGLYIYFVFYFIIFKQYKGFIKYLLESLMKYFLIFSQKYVV